MDKVLILANSSGGLFHFRGELIACLSKQYEIVSVIPDDNFKNELDAVGGNCKRINMERRGMNPFNDLMLLKSYKKIIRQERPAVVLTYTIKPNVYGGIACNKTNTPYLSNVTGLGTSIENGGIVSKISLFLYKRGLAHAHCVFFQNSQNMDLFVNQKIVRGYTELLPGSGVNIDKHFYEEYPDIKDKFNFLFVGRVMKDKGIGELLKALKIMSDEGKNVFLDIVGGAEEDYTELIEEYEKQGLVKYHGVQKDVHSFYKNTQCVVLPSYHEGMANVLLEASSTGRPVVTCRIPGCQEAFDEGKSGYGCEVKNVKSLVDAMNKMYETPWGKRKQMGKEARKKMETQFNRNLIIRKYMEQIENAIARRRS